MILGNNVRAIFSVYLLAMLSACGPTQEDAEALGFRSVKSMTEYTEAGFATMQEFQATGFSDLVQLKEYAEAGFATMQEFQATGFSDLKEYERQITFSETLTSVFSMPRVGSTLDPDVTPCRDDSLPSKSMRHSFFECTGKLSVYIDKLKSLQNDSDLRPDGRQEFMFDSTGKLVKLGVFLEGFAESVTSAEGFIKKVYAPFELKRTSQRLNIPGDFASLSGLLPWKPPGIVKDLNQRHFSFGCNAYHSDGSLSYSPRMKLTIGSPESRKWTDDGVLFPLKVQKAFRFDLYEPKSSSEKGVCVVAQINWGQTENYGKKLFEKSRVYIQILVAEFLTTSSDVAITTKRSL